MRNQSVRKSRTCADIVPIAQYFVLLCDHCIHDFPKYYATNEKSLCAPHVDILNNDRLYIFIAFGLMCSGQVTKKKYILYMRKLPNNRAVGDAAVDTFR